MSQQQQDSRANTSSYDVLHIGDVIKVEGQSVFVHVLSNKSTNIIVYEGQVLKNASVGSLVKIVKGYTIIIGRVVGEHTKQNLNNKTNVHHSFISREQSIERIIEVSIIGTFDNGTFNLGVMELPLVYSRVYLLEQQEIESLYHLADEESCIKIGSLIGSVSSSLNIPLNNFISGHTGIFGCTGSGKSNTLAKLYSATFDKFSSEPGFSQSQFILFDYHGEYKHVFGKNQSRFRPGPCIIDYSSQETSTGDFSSHIPLEQDDILELDFWATLCQANDDRQLSFLSSAISICRRITSNSKFRASQLEEALQNTLKPIIDKHINGLLQISDIMLMLRRYRLGSSISLLLNIILDVIERTINQKSYNHNSSQAEEIASKLVSGSGALFQQEIERLGSFFFFYFSCDLTLIKEFIDGTLDHSVISPMLNTLNSLKFSLTDIFYVYHDKEKSYITIYSLDLLEPSIQKLVTAVICKLKFNAQCNKSRGTSSLHIIIDEAHLILSSRRNTKDSTLQHIVDRVFEDIAFAGRKFGTFLTIACQRPSDISPNIVSQLHNIFVHRIMNKDDIDAISSNVSCLDPQLLGSISSLPNGVCIINSVSLSLPLLVKIDQLPGENQPESKSLDIHKLWSEKPKTTDQNLNLNFSTEDFEQIDKRLSTSGGENNDNED